MFDLGAQFGVPIVSHQYFWSGIPNYVEIRNYPAGRDLFPLRRGQVSLPFGRSSAADPAGSLAVAFFYDHATLFRRAQVTNKSGVAGGLYREISDRRCLASFSMRFNSSPRSLGILPWLT